MYAIFYGFLNWGKVFFVNGRSFVGLNAADETWFPKLLVKKLG